jgi:hypothetical protein
MDPNISRIIKDVELLKSGRRVSETETDIE